MMTTLSQGHHDRIIIVAIAMPMTMAIVIGVTPGAGTMIMTAVGTGLGDGRDEIHHCPTWEYDSLLCISIQLTTHSASAVVGRCRSAMRRRRVGTIGAHGHRRCSRDRRLGRNPCCLARAAP